MSKSEEKRVAERRTATFWKKWKATLAFVFLAGIVFVALVREEQTRDQNRKDNIAILRQITESGTANSTSGCNRDFRIIQGAQAILLRSKASTDRQLINGDLTKKNHKILQDGYDEALEALPLPDCRGLEIKVSANNAIPTPPALYAGSPYEDKALPNESADPPSKPAPVIDRP